MPEEQNVVKHLRRYTELPMLFDILLDKKLTLLPPSTWEDKNDAYYLEQYRQTKSLKSILALCFTTKADTSHHWKIYSGSPSGVSIRFNKVRLLSCLESAKGIRHGLVNYKLIREIEESEPQTSELPFIKRKPFVDESEYRILFESKTEEVSSKKFAINLDCIERITLSPWLPSALSKTVKAIIRQIPECGDIEIIRTGMLDNAAWKKIIR